MIARTIRSTGRVAALAAVVVTISAGTAFAVTSFTDVPPGHAHEVGVQYMEDTGITAGCTPTAYCPDAAVTRAQMGTFLHRASGNDPATEPSVNAATMTAGAVQTVTNTESVVATHNVVVVECPAGTTVVGGGGQSSRADWFLNASAPGQAVNTWGVLYYNTTGLSEEQTTTVYARCLTVGQ